MGPGLKVTWERCPSAGDQTFLEAVLPLLFLLKWQWVLRCPGVGTRTLKTSALLLASLRTFLLILRAIFVTFLKALLLTFFEGFLLTFVVGLLFTFPKANAYHCVGPARKSPFEFINDGASANVTRRTS